MNPEAIEAAARAAHEAAGLEWTDGKDWREDCARIEAKAALEAAAPYLIREARAAELEAAAEALDLPGSSATGYYASYEDAGYRDAEVHAEAWLRARAAAIRSGEA